MSVLPVAALWRMWTWTHDGNGRHAENNLITVDHGDGTFGCYLHLRQGGSFVKPGQRVWQGEAIGASGNVGLSLLPHLHFDVTDEGRKPLAGDVCRCGFRRRHPPNVQTIHVGKRCPMITINRAADQMTG